MMSSKGCEGETEGSPCVMSQKMLAQNIFPTVTT